MNGKSVMQRVFGRDSAAQKIVRQEVELLWSDSKAHDKSAILFQNVEAWMLQSVKPPDFVLNQKQNKDTGNTVHFEEAVVYSNRNNQYFTETVQKWLWVKTWYLWWSLTIVSLNDFVGDDPLTHNQISGLQ